MAPIMLLNVIVSLNAQVDIVNTINMLPLLQRNALFKGINERTFCQSIAYNPIDASTQPKKIIYRYENCSCMDANFPNILEEEYTMKVNNRNKHFFILKDFIPILLRFD